MGKKIKNLFITRRVWGILMKGRINWPILCFCRGKGEKRNFYHSILIWMRASDSYLYFKQGSHLHPVFWIHISQFRTNGFSLCSAARLPRVQILLSLRNDALLVAINRILGTGSSPYYTCIQTQVSEITSVYQYFTSLY